MFAKLETYFDLLTRQGPGRGYHTVPTKSVMTVRPDNPDSGKVFGVCHGFRVCMGVHYLGGYIGDDDSKSDWLRERTLTRKNNINTISEKAGKYPQESYASVVRMIQ